MSVAYDGGSVARPRLRKRLGMSSAIALIFLGSTAIASDSPQKWLPVDAVLDGGFELDNLATSWQFTQHAGVLAYKFEHDDQNKSEGKQSLRVTRTAEQVFGSIHQSTKKLASGRYRLVADARTEAVTGRGWSLKVTVRHRDGRFDLIESARLKKDTAWQKLSVEFTVDANTEIVSLGATLVGGGRAWLDGVRLEREQP
jgi:hypothetical protein